MTSITRLNQKGEKIKFSIAYVCKKENKYWKADRSQHNVVTIKNITTGKSCKIDYWGSVVEPNQDSEKGLWGALSCIELDYTSAENSFKDFCEEFGYDMCSDKAITIFMGCKASKEKIYRVYGSEFTQEFSNEISRNQ